MLTLDNLRAWGADVDDGMKRCMNNEAFYLRMVSKSLQGTSFEDLKQAVTDGDLTRGFEIAHSLKGVTGNLALTPVDKPIREITELLRAGTQADYTALLEAGAGRHERLMRRAHVRKALPAQ